MWHSNRLDHLGQDVRHAIRMLRNSPGFTLAVAATLALGIGANTAMFSVVNAVLLRPLPFPQPDRLVQISGHSVRQQASLVTLRNHSRTAEYAAYTNGGELSLTDQGEPHRLTGSVVAANLFSVLQVQRLLGRTFIAGEDTW